MSTGALRARMAGLVAGALLLAPQAAHACSVCTGGQNPDVGRAFLLGSLALSVLPLAAVGGLSFWLWRRARALARSAALRESSARPGV